MGVRRILGGDRTYYSIFIGSSCRFLIHNKFWLLKGGSGLRAWRSCTVFDIKLVCQRLNLHWALFGGQEKLLSLGHHSLCLDHWFFFWQFWELFSWRFFSHQNCLSWPFATLAHFLTHSHGSDRKIAHLSTVSCIGSLEQFLCGQTLLMGLFCGVDGFSDNFGIFSIDHWIWEFSCQTSPLTHIELFEFIGAWIGSLTSDLGQ